MTRIIPLVPLLVVFAAVAISIGSVLITQQRPSELEVTASAEPQMRVTSSASDAPLVRYNDELRSRGNMEIILRQSAFSKTRSAFSRARAPRATSEPMLSTPPLNAKFFGIARTGSSVRALIAWRENEEIVEISVGEETPLGRVIAIHDHEIQFEKDGVAETLSLF